MATTLADLWLATIREVVEAIDAAEKHPRDLRRVHDLKRSIDPWDALADVLGRLHDTEQERDRLREALRLALLWLPEPGDVPSNPAAQEQIREIRAAFDAPPPSGAVVDARTLGLPVNGEPPPSADPATCEHPGPLIRWDGASGETEYWRCPACGAQGGYELPQ